MVPTPRVSWGKPFFTHFWNMYWSNLSINNNNNNLMNSLQKDACRMSKRLLLISNSDLHVRRENMFISKLSWNALVSHSETENNSCKYYHKNTRYLVSKTQILCKLCTILTWQYISIIKFWNGSTLQSWKKERINGA